MKRWRSDGNPFIFKPAQSGKTCEMVELSRKTNNQTSWKANFCPSSSPFSYLISQNSKSQKLQSRSSFPPKRASCFRDIASIFPFPAAQKSPEDGWWSSYRFDKVRMYWSAPDCTHTRISPGENSDRRKYASEKISHTKKTKSCFVFEPENLASLFSCSRDESIAKGTTFLRTCVCYTLHLPPEYQISQIIDWAGNTGAGRAIIYLGYIWGNFPVLFFVRKNKRAREVRDGIGAKLVNW